MIAPESSLKDAPNVFKNDWSSVKEVEEALARQKAKEKADRDEKARLKKLKEEADAKKTQAERDAEVALNEAKEKADAETKAKIDEAIGNQREAEAKLATVSKELENWQMYHENVSRQLRLFEEEYPIKASSFNRKDVWVIQASSRPSWVEGAVTYVDGQYCVAVLDKKNVSQALKLELVDDNRPAGPWTIRLNGNYLAMLANKDGTPMVDEINNSEDGGGNYMKIGVVTNADITGLGFQGLNFTEWEKGRQCFVKIVGGYHL